MINNIGDLCVSVEVVLMVSIVVLECARTCAFCLLGLLQGFEFVKNEKAEAETETSFFSIVIILLACVGCSAASFW